MRYVFSLKEQLPVLQDYTKGLIPELVDTLMSSVMNDQYRYWPVNLKKYLNQCLPTMLLSALVSLAIYDTIAPSGKHMVNTYMLLNDLWTAQIEAESNEGEVYSGQHVGVDLHNFEDVCDLAALLANGVLDFIESVGILDFEYFIEICKSFSHQLDRVYRFNVDEIRIVEILLSKRAVILNGESTKYIDVF